MSTRTGRNIGRGKQNKIFISWSGDISKEIAKGIKYVLEDIIFKGTDLSCFVSDIDIASGTDWWKKIKGELKTCKLGILCVTKENVRAPWIYFESGAMVARDIPTIPLLINCSFNSINDSPFSGKQCVDFYDKQKFIKMIFEINSLMSLLSVERTQMDSISMNGYDILKDRLTDELKQLKNMRIFNEKYIYPQSVSTVNLNTLFISAPMASIDDSEYNDLRTYLLSLKKTLIKIGFSDVKCPLFDKGDKTVFDGKIKAIKDNFSNLKQVDSMLVIYPQNVPSSSLVELGYGIALCKKLVLFYKDELPYILQEAGENIKHIKTFQFDKFENIGKIIESNGMDIFEGESFE